MCIFQSENTGANGMTLSDPFTDSAGAMLKYIDRLWFPATNPAEYKDEFSGRNCEMSGWVLYLGCKQVQFQNVEGGEMDTVVKLGFQESET